MAKFLDSSGLTALWARIKQYVYTTTSNQDVTLHVGNTSATIPNRISQLSGYEDYIKGLSVSGTTITYTKGNGNTGTITTQDTNTDTKVTQTNSTNTSSYPILLKNGTGSGTKTDTVLFNSGVTVKPSTGEVTATTFSGTATNATSDANGNNIAATYATKTETTGMIRYKGTKANKEALIEVTPQNATVGDLYTLQDSGDEYFVKAITNDEKLYYSLKAIGGTAVLSGNIDTSASNTGIKTEAQLAAAISSQSDALSTYPLISSTYVQTPWQPNVASEIMYRLVPVSSSEYGLTLVFVTQNAVDNGLHKAYAVRSSTEGGLNSLTGELYYEGQLFADVTGGFPSAADIRAFFIFGGGVQWEQMGATVDSANTGFFKGTCSTAAATTSKVVACANFQSVDLVKGTLIYVTFSTTNSGAVGSLTMNVNGTGARPIKKMSKNSVANLTHAGELQANQTLLFSYDGTNWVCMTLDYDTTYSALSQADATAGTATTARLITAKVLHDTIAEAMTSVAGALVYKGTIIDQSSLLATPLSKGWYYIVNATSMIIGVNTGSSPKYVTCETGDMVIVKVAGTYANTDAGKKSLVDVIDVIQSNMEAIPVSDIENLSLA